MSISIPFWMACRSQVVQAVGCSGKSCNDTLVKYIAGIAGSGIPRNVLLEEATGAWCIYCIENTRITDSLKTEHPDRVIPVAIHYNDAMESDLRLLADYTANSFPSSLVNRKYFGDLRSFASCPKKKQRMLFGLWILRP